MSTRILINICCCFVLTLSATFASCTSATANNGALPSAIDSLAARVTEGTSAGRIIFREEPADSEPAAPEPKDPDKPEEPKDSE